MIEPLRRSDIPKQLIETLERNGYSPDEVMQWTYNEQEGLFAVRMIPRSEIVNITITVEAL